MPDMKLHTDASSPATRDLRDTMHHILPVAGSRKRTCGFTLIESMVVVVILGILAALVLPNVIGNVDKAQAAKVKQDLQAFDTALSLFRLDNFKYPTTDQGLQALVQQPNDPTIRNWKQGGYLRGGVRKD